MNNEELLADIDSTLHGAPTYLYELLTRCQMVLKEQAELIAAAPAKPTETAISGALKLAANRLESLDT